MAANQARRGGCSPGKPAPVRPPYPQCGPVPHCISISCPAREKLGCAPRHRSAPLQNKCSNPHPGRPPPPLPLSPLNTARFRAQPGRVSGVRHQPEPVGRRHLLHAHLRHQRSGPRGLQARCCNHRVRVAAHAAAAAHAVVVWAAPSPCAPAHSMAQGWRAVAALSSLVMLRLLCVCALPCLYLYGIFRFILFG